MTRQGWPGLSLGCSHGELCGAIIIHLANRVWPLEEIFSMFSVGVQLYHHMLSNSVGAFSAGDVLPCIMIIEIDHSLFPLTNDFPVCLC